MNVNASYGLLFIEITVLLVVTVLINYLNIYDASNAHRYVYGKWQMAHDIRRSAHNCSCDRNHGMQAFIPTQQNG